MDLLDWLVVGGYFVVMVGIGLWAKARIHDSHDFFTAGGRMPWWLSGVTLVYSTIGGLWADALTDMGQFVIQLVAGIVLFVAVLAALDGIPTLWTLWDKLPAGHAEPFNGQYTALFVLVYLLINTLSYN